MLQELADYIRDRATVLEAASEDKQQEQARIGQYVQFLERCVDATSEEAAVDVMFEDTGGFKGNYFQHLGRHAKYFSEFFIKVILFTMDFKNDDYTTGSYVGRSFKKCTRLLPPQVQRLLSDMYASPVFPSAATVSRANLYIDVSYMKLMQALHDGMILAACIFFGLSDASPIGGRLYQITEYYVIGSKDDPDLIVKLGTWTLELRSFSKDPTQLTADDLGRMDWLMDKIRDAKHLHAFIPTCMESTNSGSEIRSICFLHQCRTESSSWNQVSKLCELLFFLYAGPGARTWIEENLFGGPGIIPTLAPSPTSRRG
jgi:hypothetical protein